MCSFSASGINVPPMFIHARQRMADYSRSHLSEDPVLLLLDNHSSHCSLNTYNFCKERGMILLTIPPHTSHRVQPLDVTFYGPLKTAYNSECLNEKNYA
ncbi:hypothetical protein HUJ04_011237 [Dendroctonus ponderosae]|nr:hypothetical protein HUJ04_011237 [Dendroctonus ponderosae]